MYYKAVEILERLLKNKLHNFYQPYKELEEAILELKTEKKCDNCINFDRINKTKSRTCIYSNKCFRFDKEKGDYYERML